MTAPRLWIPLAPPEQNARMDLSLILRDMETAAPKPSLWVTRLDLCIRLVTMLILAGFTYLWGYTSLRADLGLPGFVGALVFGFLGLASLGRHGVIGQFARSLPGWPPFGYAILGVSCATLIWPQADLLWSVLWALFLILIGFLACSAVVLLRDGDEARNLYQLQSYLRKLPRRERRATLQRLRHGANALAR